jgi:hypothetical protein
MFQVPIPHIFLQVRPGLSADFAPLLREGVGVNAVSGASLRSVMENVLGMAPDYVTERVLTVFLDGSPVDDIEAVTVHPGAELALGAAMPGLAGIAMRRGSPVKAFREAIAARPDCGGKSSGDAAILVKLFNMVADEAGPEVLRRGVTLRAERLERFLAERGPDFRDGLLGIRADGLPVSRAALAYALSAGPEHDIRLTVEETA